VEPFAGDALEENLHPLGQIFYSFSTTVCVPASKAQEDGLALGAQAGQKRLTEVLTEGGFSRSLGVRPRRPGGDRFGPMGAGGAVAKMVDVAAGRQTAAGVELDYTTRSAPSTDRCGKLPSDSG
jgi:hypothetical protein